MGVGLLLSFERVEIDGAKTSESKVSSGGGPIVTCEHYSASGDDSYPLPEDYVVFVDVQRAGGYSVVGYIDPKMEPMSTAGEKRIYARSSAGASVVHLWLKSNGDAILSNAEGAIELKSNGDIELTGANVRISADSVDINGATISGSGGITSAAGVSLDSHTHAQPPDSFGNVEQETLPPS